MNTLVSGEAYVAAINERDSDRASRRAFQHLAISLTRAGGSLFDFGAGPGLDARAYAEHGLHVGAYDVDPAMRAYFSQHCGGLSASGRIHSNAGSYSDFLRETALAGGENVELITANFGPLNLVPDPGELFQKFTQMLTVDGRVLVSVLNPFFVGDLRYGWWWRNLSRLWSNGEYSVTGAQAPITRWTPRRLAARVSPGFALEAVYAGRPASGSQALPARLGLGLFDLPALASCRFIFMLFHRGSRAP
ncbi:MAG TPA: methyltransferase domain-containing protein [Steroidobacteraceae bacterium]|nr:methyltransferase domain-containing protein [Steroidobacteraceae bacterium]